MKFGNFVIMDFECGLVGLESGLVDLEIGLVDLESRLVGLECGLVDLESGSWISAKLKKQEYAFLLPRGGSRSLAEAPSGGLGGSSRPPESVLGVPAGSLWASQNLKQKCPWFFPLCLQPGESVLGSR